MTLNKLLELLEEARGRVDGESEVKAWCPYSQEWEPVYNVEILCTGEIRLTTQ